MRDDCCAHEMSVLKGFESDRAHADAGMLASVGELELQAVSVRARRDPFRGPFRAAGPRRFAGGSSGVALRTTLREPAAECATRWSSPGAGRWTHAQRI